jgi:hypothetical protein
MAVTRPVDILIRLRQLTDGLEQGVSQRVLINEMEELFAAEPIAACGYGSHVQRIMNLLNNPAYGWSDILEEIRILEECLQTDEYGFCEHQNGGRFF